MEKSLRFIFLILLIIGCAGNPNLKRYSSDHGVVLQIELKSPVIEANQKIKFPGPHQGWNAFVREFPKPPDSESNIKSKLMLTCKFNEQGKIISSKVIKEIGIEATKIVLDVLDHTQFKPGLADENPISSELLLTFTFDFTKKLLPFKVKHVR